MEQRRYWLWQKTSLPRVAKCNLSKVVSLLPEILFLLFQSQVPRDSLALSNNLKNKCITHTNAFLPPFVSRFQRQIMDMPFSRDSTQSSYHASALQLLHKSFASSKWRDFISIRMNHKCRRRVPSRFKLRHRTDSLYSFQRRGAGESGGRKAVKHHSQTMRLFEERENEFRAWIARPNPAKIGTIFASRGVIGCDLQGRGISC